MLSQPRYPNTIPHHNNGFNTPLHNKERKKHEKARHSNKTSPNRLNQSERPFDVELYAPNHSGGHSCHIRGNDTITLSHREDKIVDYYQSEPRPSNANENSSGTGDNNTFMPKSVLRRNMKASLLLVCTSIVFFATVMPYMISSLIDHFLVQWVMPSALKFAALWILNTNSFINVYIYSAVYSEFRHHLRNVFVSLCGCNCTSKQNCGTKRRGKHQSKRRRKSNCQVSHSASLKGNSDAVSKSFESRHDEQEHPRDNNVLNGIEDCSTRDWTSSQMGEDSNRRVTQSQQRLVLVPRNDAGALFKARPSSGGYTPSQNVAGNQPISPAIMLSLQDKSLPSVEI